MSVAEVSGTQQGEQQEMAGHGVLQRVILPRPTDSVDARALYLEEPAGFWCELNSRRCAGVPAGCRVSFATYFNAFPASYWQRWSRLEEVVLRMSVRGNGRIEVYCSRWQGEAMVLDGKPVRGNAELEFRVPLEGFGDGGWIWFDATAEDTTLQIVEAAWTTNEGLPQPRIAVGTTTFNRPDDTLAMLRGLGEDAEVLRSLAKVFVADQGTAKVREHAEFAEVAGLLGDRLEVIDQPNIGGSGGFTRSFYEVLQRPEIDQLVLLDDDIFLEPDSVLRASAFASAARQPMIVGGQMLNLLSPSKLHSMGEAINLDIAMWGPAPNAKVGHDFARTPLRDEPALHRRIDATYNGWWMSLFPREVIEQVGLPLPLFIKWDDAEYNLRAQAAGYPTVTVPGTGVWHMPWSGKTDTFDWTLYFHRRNRLITAALHGDDPRKILLRHGLRDQFKRLMGMEYSTVAMEIKATEDFLAGPHTLFGQLGTALGDVQRLRAQYPDAKLSRSPQDFPSPSMDITSANRMLTPPTGKLNILKTAAQAITHNLRAPSAESGARPQMNVPSDKLLWFLLGRLDSALVSLPDGQTVSFRKRDHKTFRQLAGRVARVYTRLMREWPRIQQEYRAALPEVTSTDSWRKVYED